VGASDESREEIEQVRESPLQGVGDVPAAKVHDFYPKLAGGGLAIYAMGLRRATVRLGHGSSSGL